MKTSELTESALDWAVAKCEVIELYIAQNNEYPNELRISGNISKNYTPSTCWLQGGKIIEREGIWVRKIRPDSFVARTDAEDYYQDGMEGPTFLIAAMRCYVASKFGNGVMVPIELAGAKS